MEGHQLAPTLENCLGSHPDSPYRDLGPVADRAIRADAAAIEMVLDVMWHEGAAVDEGVLAKHFSWLGHTLRMRGLSTQAVGDCVLELLERDGGPQDAVQQLLRVNLAEWLAGTSGSGPSDWQPQAGTAADPQSVMRLTELLVEGDVGAAWGFIGQAVGGGGTLDQAEPLLRSAMYEVGRRWADGDASVQQERVATATAQLLLARFDASESAHNLQEKVVLVMSVPGNTHRLGPRLVADGLAMHGFDVLCRTDVPDLQAALELVRLFQPELVGLSVAMPHGIRDARAIVEAIPKILDPTPPVLVGGLAVTAHPELFRAGLPGATVATGDLHQTVELARTLLGRP